MAKKNANTKSDKPVTVHTQDRAHLTIDKSNSADPAYLAGINEAIREISREREPLLKLVHARRVRFDEKGSATSHKLVALNVALRHLEDTRSWQQGERPSDSLDSGSQQAIQKAAELLRALAGSDNNSGLSQEAKSFTEYLSKREISIPTSTLNIILGLATAVLTLKENEMVKKVAELETELETLPNKEANEGPSQAEIDQVVEDLLRNGPEAEELP